MMYRNLLDPEHWAMTSHHPWPSQRSAGHKT